MRQPDHARSSVLAGLHRSSLTGWIAVALSVALGVVVLAAVDSPEHAAAVRAGAPTEISNASTTPPASDVSLAVQPPPVVSLAPRRTTSIPVPASRVNETHASSLASGGIPTTALRAYEQAADRERLLDPACGLTWPLLAGIGRAESDHGRFAGAVLHTDGISTPRVIGIPLDGNGTALIRDTDGGRLDGDTVYDRAVGSMQFIPSTWAGYGVDANSDGIADPFNIFDAAAATANYLCSTGGDLTTLAGQMSAVHVYNDSDAYVSTVLQLEAIYASGVPGMTVPIVPADPNPAPPRLIVPPANPGPPLGVPQPPQRKPTEATLSAPTSSAPTSPAPSSQSSTPTVTGTPCPAASDTPSTGSSASPSTSATVSPGPEATDCVIPSSSDTPTATSGSTPAPSDSTEAGPPATSPST